MGLSFKIFGLKLLEKMFHMLLFCLIEWRLVGVFGDEVKSVSVMEGDSLNLQTHLTDIQTVHLILWRFGPYDTPIVSNYRDISKISIYDNVLDGRFRDRLQVNNQTGDLTITNITTKHTGLYQINIFLSISRSDPIKVTSYRFNVTVYARLPVPVITRNSLQNSSLSSNCSFLCSVMNVINVTDVSLSWYKGNSLLSSISVSDLNISSISLHLKCLDDSYSCVVNNPISNQTQHLNITDVCQPCSDSLNCCDTTKAVIRLVASALVGVATVAVLIYDIRSRRAEQERSQ
nr:SLAM family member 9-like isoform X1 [Misgurnus anguillicaudatus]